MNRGMTKDVHLSFADNRNKKLSSDSTKFLDECGRMINNGLTKIVTDYRDLPCV